MLRVIIVLTFLLVLGACGATESSRSSYSMNPATNANIIGGTEVLPGDLNSHSVVLIYGEKASGESYICTGSFISADTVLTAAHCIVSDITLMSLFYGEKLFSSEQQSLPITAVKAHERYHPGTLEDRNDIALIHFSGGLPAGAKIASLDESSSLQSALDLQSYGYGVTQGSQDFTQDFSTLRKVSLQGLTLTAIDPGLLQLTQDQGRGVCFGDSGGPVFSAGNTIFAIASGVLEKDDSSSSDACDNKSFFTQVSTYKPWIQENLPGSR